MGLSTKSSPPRKKIRSVVSTVEAMIGVSIAGRYKNASYLLVPGPLEPQCTIITPQQAAISLSFLNKATHTRSYPAYLCRFFGDTLSFTSSLILPYPSFLSITSPNPHQKSHHVIRRGSNSPGLDWTRAGWYPLSAFTTSRLHLWRYPTVVWGEIRTQDHQ